MKKKAFRRLLRVLAVIALFIVVVSLWYHISVELKPPEIPDKSMKLPHLETINDTTFRAGPGWLRKNKYGLWELYVEGDPFSMGYMNGLLCSKLINEQEEAFVERLYELVPSPFYLNNLKYFVSVFNRNLDRYIDDEYLEEIYGVSLFADEGFEYIGTPYQRILNYHAAHDIGHALQNMQLVGCTSFALWGGHSSEGKLLMGRNFDFYVGDRFAENKIVCFFNPDQGYKMMTIAWGGMIGVVSGMNEKGLCITLNAAKSKVPLKASTPVSIVARKILQYASDIHEAVRIASDYEVFVSETFLIASAKDQKAIIIEKTPDVQGVYAVDTNYIIATNHFQSPELKNTERNIRQMNESASWYRFQRVDELLAADSIQDVKSMVDVLRDTKGLNNQDIGLGNEKAVNQLIAHHSVVFSPAERKVWMSTSPYQLGSYVEYCLDDVFADTSMAGPKDFSAAIEPDPLLNTRAYSDFKKYKHLALKAKSLVAEENHDAAQIILPQELINLNPENFEAYSLAAEISLVSGKTEDALRYLNTALTKEIPNLWDKENILEKIRNLN